MAAAIKKDFKRPKIIYQELTQGSCFALDIKGEYYVNNTAYIMTGKNLAYFIKLLNSKIIEKAYSLFYSTRIGAEGIRWLSQNIMNLPIPLPDRVEHKTVDAIIQTNDNMLIEKLICRIFSFSEDEVEILTI